MKNDIYVANIYKISVLTYLFIIVHYIFISLILSRELKRHTEYT